MENNFNDKRRVQNRIFAGLILVAVGAAFLLRNTGFPLPYWLFTWPVILILIGLYSGVKHNFSNNSWIILIAIGSYFLIDKFLVNLHLATYFWPIAIIGVGIYFIVRPERKKNFEFKNYDKLSSSENINSSAWQQTNVKGSYSDGDNLVKVDSVFSGVQRTIVSKNFQGGKIACVFGGATIDLSQADIHGRVELKMDVVFGGTKLIVPPHWTIYNEIDGAFHGVDDKRKFNASTGINPEKVLVLKGSVVFGGVEIKSYN